MIHRTKLFWASVLLLALGASLRLAFMRVHGLNPDETFTIGFGQQSLGFLAGDFANTQYDVHPKLYYLLLHLWLPLAGSSEIGTRLPGVLADLLLGAALIQMARSAFGGRAALLAGLLWSINPTLIWATAQVRMYALLALWAALTALFLIKALIRPRAVWWLCFGLAALAAAYTHVLGGIVLAGVGAAAAGWAILRRRLAGLAVVAGVGLLYLPYLWRLWEVRAISKTLATTIPRNPLEFVRLLVTSLLANRLPLPGAVLWALTGVCLLLVFLSLRARRRALAGLLLLSMGVMSAGAGYFALGETVFSSNYLAYIAPAFLLSLAAGLSLLPWPPLRAGALAVVMAASLYGLVYQAQPSASDDFPAAARFVETYGDGGDLVIVMTSYAGPTFRTYYHGAGAVIAPWHTFPPDLPAEEIASLLAGRDTAWLALYATNTSDPGGVLDGWFRARYPVRTEAFPAGVTIRGYDLRPMTNALPPEATPLDAVFEGQAALRGYQVYQLDVSRRDDRLHPPSGWVHVTLYWEAIMPGVAFEPRVQIENDLGEIYGVNLVRGTEVFALHPTPTWQPGQVWRSDFDINLNPEMPPGDYKIVLRVFSPGDPRAWVISSGANTGNSWLIVERVVVGQ